MADNSKQEKPAIGTIPVRTPIYDVIRNAGAKADYIILGESHHNDRSLAQFVSKPETMKALAEAGVSHLCMEMPVRKQNLVKIYQNEDISREQFIEKMAEDIIPFFYGHDMRKAVTEQEARFGSVADIIKNAAKFGIDVHFVDGGEGGSNKFISTYMDNLLDAMDEYAKQHHLTEEQMEKLAQDPKKIPDLIKYANKYIEKHFPETMEMAKDLRKMEGRLAGDVALAERIESVTNGEKTAIFYGASHGLMTKKDLDDALHGKVMNITLVGEKKDTDLFKIATDAPDFVYNLKKDKTTMSPSADPEFKSSVDYDKKKDKASVETETPQVASGEPLKVVSTPVRPQ